MDTCFKFPQGENVNLFKSNEFGLVGSYNNSIECVQQALGHQLFLATETGISKPWNLKSSVKIRTNRKAFSQQRPYNRIRKPSQTITCWPKPTTTRSLVLSRARALYYEFQFSMIGFPWYISFLLLFMSILVEVLLLEKGNHFTKKLSLPYTQAFKTDVIFTLTKRPPEKNVSLGFSSSYLLRKETVVFSLM